MTYDLVPAQTLGDEEGQNAPSVSGRSESPCRAGPWPFAWPARVGMRARAGNVHVYVRR
jgi:hypothetical protein